MANDPERRAANAAAIDESQFDALVCSSASAVLLVTGYWPVMGGSLAVLTREGEAFALVPEDEHELATETSGAELIAYKPAGLDSLASRTESLHAPLRDLLTRLGLRSARIGCELEESMQPSTYIAAVQFRAALPELLTDLESSNSVVACDALLERLKARKTRIELEQMRLGARIASHGFARAEKVLRAGMREPEIAAEAHGAFDTSEEAKQAHRSYGGFYCMSGPNSALAAAAYARTRQRTIVDGDLVMLHANNCADGYWTDITRTWTAGTPVERHEKMQAAIAKARAQALATVKPGARASDVDRAARDVMAEHGFGAAFKHAAGHGVGFAAANPHGMPRIHPRSPDILEQGMTFNIEPAAYFDGYGGMRHCDVVAVTKDGVDVLTDF